MSASITATLVWWLAPLRWNLPAQLFGTPMQSIHGALAMRFHWPL